MKGCSQWIDAIADCALGQTPGADLAAHVASCGQCENALRESRAMAERMDETLHRLGAAEPPAYGPQRVMARIAAQPAGRAFWKWTAAASAALAMVIVIAMWVGGRSAPEAPVGVKALSVWRSPTQGLLRPPVSEAWITTPRLGEGFFKIKPSGEIHAQ